MSNFKLVKTAAALALGASVVTSAVATTDASAASKYKIKSGKLVYAKSGKVVKGYVTYKSILYKNGKKLTGLKGKTYYKAGKKATGTYKGAYYVKGVKKVTTGTYNKAYYVKGVKKVSTGLYASKYYKDGKLATGTYKGAYYVKGLKKVTTGTYNGAYYVKGKKVVSTGLYADKLYVAGKLNKGYKLYNENLYKDAVLNTELALFEGKLYDGAKLNEGHKIFKDELYNGSELNKELALFEGKLYDGAKLNEGIKKFEDKWYNNAELADGTFTDEGVEKAFENGVEVGAKVKSVEAINAKQVKVTFNKTVDASTLVSNTTTGALVSGAVSISRTIPALAPNTDQNIAAAITGKVSEDGRSIVLTLGNNEYLEGTYAVTVSDKVEAKDGSALKAFAGTISVEDKVAPTVEKVEFNPSTGNIEFTVSEPIATPDVLRINGTPVPASDITPVTGSNNTKFTVAKPASVTAGSTASIYLAGAKDYAGNILTAFNGNVTIANDQSAVTIDSVKQISSNKVALTFNKPLKASTIADTDFTALIDGKTLVAGTDVTYALDTTDKTNKTVIATFPGNTTNVATKPAYFYGTASTKDLTFVVANNAIEDVYGQKVATTTKSVTMTKDVTGPTAVSSKLSKDGKAIYIQLNEELTGTAGTTAPTLEAVRVNGVDDTASYSATLENDDNGELTLIKVVKTGSADIPAGTITVRLAAGQVTDVHTNASKAISVNTTVDASTSDLKVVTNGITNYTTNSAKNHFTVEFNKDVTAATALDPANYTLDGAALPAGTDIYFDSTNSTTKVHIVLPTSSVNIGNQSDGATARLAVSGVKSVSGQTVKSTSDTVKVNDNTSATVKSVSVVGNTIFVKFNENVAGTLTGSALTNFDITVDGTALNLGTAGQTDGVAGTATAQIVAGQEDTVQITVSPATQGTAPNTDFAASNWNPAKTIAVSYKGTALADANGFTVAASKAPVANK